MPRGRHSKKDVEKALAYAESRGWTVERGGSHRWGVGRCGRGCKISIFSTPRNPTNHAKQIRRAVDRCDHHP